MPAPKIKLLYYKHILDLAFRDFFEDYGGSFVKDDSRAGCWVLAKPIAKSVLVKYFTDAVRRHILEHTEDWSPASPAYYFIIGSCVPKDNILLSLYSRDFERRMQEFAYGGCRYYLSENDIYVDLDRLNDVAMKVFDKAFSSRKPFSRSNVFFIKHDRLDCRLMYKTIRSLYGKVNCVNLFKTLNADIKPVVHSLNERIDNRLSRAFDDIFKTDEYLAAKDEIAFYVDGKIRNFNGQEQKV